MSSMLPHISIGYRRYVVVLASVVLVLLTSCPIKASIKNLVGIPVNTEQGTTTSNRALIGNGVERCANGETRDIEFPQAGSPQTTNLLPPAILTSVYLSPGITPYWQQSHPPYGNLKISNGLPIFLQYRKLVI